MYKMTSYFDILKNIIYIVSGNIYIYKPHGGGYPLPILTTKLIDNRLINVASDMIYYVNYHINI